MTGGMAGMRPNGGMVGVKMMPGTQGKPDMKMDLNDIEFDAYLANNRTLDDPELIRVAAGGKIRLRVINGAASTNFHIDLGSLHCTVAAVAGTLLTPLTVHPFGLAMAPSLNFLVGLPKNACLWPNP